nr:MAG TPA: hypothetical protein [Caudoviricetes sp.]
MRITCASLRFVYVLVKTYFAPIGTRFKLT